MMRCDGCGVESRLLGDGDVCPECRVRRAHVSAARMTFCTLALTGLGWIFLAAPGAEVLAWMLINAGLVLALAAPLAWIHTMGNVAGALIAGARLRRVVLGEGRLLSTFRVAGLRVEWRPHPWGAWVGWAFPERRDKRWRRALAVAAGPATLILLAVPLAFLIPAARYRIGPCIELCVLIAYARALCMTFAVSVISRGDGLGWSDVRTFVRILQAAPEALAAHALASTAKDELDAGRADAAVEVSERALKRFPESTDLRWTLANALMDAGDLQAARREYHALLSSEGLDAQSRAITRNNIAWCDLMTRDASLLPEADALSREAMLDLAWAPYANGTRGAVLIELGRVDEGLPLVEKAFRGNEAPELKALNACYLAIGHRMRGESEPAGRWAKRARTLDPGSSLLPRTEALIAMVS